MRVDAAAQTLSAVNCPACGTVREAAPHADWLRDGGVERCPICGGSEFFIRRDFPQRLGLLIVIVAAIASLVLLRSHTLAALAILAGVVVLDAVIYLFVGRVTVCYRCRTEFRGVTANPAHEGFDLATAEKYPRT